MNVHGFFLRHTFKKYTSAGSNLIKHLDRLCEYFCC